MAQVSFQDAEFERIHGSVHRGLELYEQVLADIAGKVVRGLATAQDKDTYLDALLMGEVCARRLKLYPQADRFDSELEELIKDRPEKAWVFYRNRAERLRKEATTMSGEDQRQWLSQAEALLLRSLHLLEQNGGSVAEQGATEHLLGRLYATVGDERRAADYMAAARTDLPRGGNEYYLLYFLLDDLELAAYYGLRGMMPLRTALGCIPASWRLGNRKPPLHLLRACLNLAGLMLPVKYSRRLLRRWGRLAPHLAA